MPVLNSFTVTIPAGDSISNAVDLSTAVQVLRLIMPPAWDGAPLTFLTSPDGINFYSMYHVTPNAMAPFELTLPNPVADSAITMPPNMASNVGRIKIRSGTSIVPVVQSASRLFTIVAAMPGGTAWQ